MPGGALRRTEFYQYFSWLDETGGAVNVPVGFVVIGVARAPDDFFCTQCIAKDFRGGRLRQPGIAVVVQDALFCCQNRCRRPLR